VSPLSFAFIGNFDPPHSTENELARALINNGHSVGQAQEGTPGDLDALIEWLQHPPADLRPVDVVLWTRTASLAEKSGTERYWKLLATARQAGVPVVGYHLDRWWGLARQAEIEMDPFFRVDLLVSPDGGHDEQWEKAGVNHVWFPPGISARHCRLGTPRPEFTSDIAFVGSWQGGYHPEDVYRPALINWLKRNYDRRVKFWPEPGQHAIRGDDLTDLYASVKVVVGTSCLAPKVDGTPMTHYWSDRIPETLGRGGLLVHPHVDGLWDHFKMRHTPIISYTVGDLDRMGHVIDAAFEMTGSAAINGLTPDEHRQRQCDFVREHHSYETRMRQLVDLLTERGMLR